jgi:hypothetical protein
MDRALFSTTFFFHAVVSGSDEATVTDLPRVVELKLIQAERGRISTHERSIWRYGFNVQHLCPEPLDDNGLAWGSRLDYCSENEGAGVKSGILAWLLDRSHG